LEQKARN
jgi:hypothetical protein